MPIFVEPRQYYNCKILDIKTVNFPERVYSECKEAAGGEVHQSPLTCDTAEEARSSERAAAQCLAFTCSCPLTYIHMSASRRARP